MYPYGYLTIKEILYNETRRGNKNIKKHNASGVVTQATKNIVVALKIPLRSSNDSNINFGESPDKSHIDSCGRIANMQNKSRTQT